MRYLIIRVLGFQGARHRVRERQLLDIVPRALAVLTTLACLLMTSACTTAPTAPNGHVHGPHVFPGHGPKLIGKSGVSP